MPLVAVDGLESFYENVFKEHQIGHGDMLARYRGSLLQNGSGFMIPAFLRTLLTRLSSFAKPLMKSATPHVRSALEAAKPHLKSAADSIVSEAATSVGSKIGEYLAPQTQKQTGGGRKRKKKQKTKRSSIKRRHHLHPRDIPDVF